MPRRHLKFLLTIHHFLSIHMSVIWAVDRWIFHSRKLKRNCWAFKTIYLVTIFKDTLFEKLLKNINGIEQQWQWIVLSYLQGNSKDVMRTWLSCYQQNFKCNPLFSFLLGLYSILSQVSSHSLFLALPPLLGCRRMAMAICLLENPTWWPRGLKLNMAKTNS